MWLTPAGARAALGPEARPVIAGGAPEADRPRRQPEVVAVAVACGAASIAFGIIPSPLFHAAKETGRALAQVAGLT